VLDCFGKGITTAQPGSVQRLEVVVSDIDRGESGFAPGPDPQRRSYLTYASFSDPDGNGWLLQEVKERLPGREWGD
jgi:hypothetical protein